MLALVARQQPDKAQSTSAAAQQHPQPHGKSAAVQAKGDRGPSAQRAPTAALP